MGLESESTAEKTEFSKVKLWFTRNAKLLVVCFAVGMICHAQMYLNGLSNPDAVVSLSNPNGYGSFIPHAWDISLGRWGLLFAACAKFGLCSPILTSAITIALFALGVVALIDRLGIKRACLRYVSSILFIASPFVSCCITYYYCSNSYALSFLCAVLAACLVGRVGAVGKPVALVGAVALLAFSLGCYQASLGVFCVAVLLVMVRSLMGGCSESLTSPACDARGEAQNPYREEGRSADSLSAKQLAVFFGVAVAVCAAGAVLYYALTEISLSVLGIGLSAYGGASSVGADSILGSLTSSVPSAYVAFSDGLFSHGIFGNHFGWVYVAVVGMIIAVVAFVRLAAINSVKRLGGERYGAALRCAYSLCRQRYPGYRSQLRVSHPAYAGRLRGFFSASAPVGAAFARFARPRQCAPAHAREGYVRRLLLPYCRRGVVVRAAVECGCRGYAGMPEPNCFFGHPNCRCA